MSDYFDSMAKRVDAANSCADLRNMSGSITKTVNGTVAAVQAQIAAIQNQVNNMADQLNKVGAHVGTLSLTQSTATQVATAGATGLAVSDLNSAIAYCKAQGAALQAYGTAHTATVAQEVLALRADIKAVTDVYNLAVTQVANLTAEVTSLTSGLAKIESAIATAATRFPNCSI